MFTSSRQINATEGPILPQMLQYSLPLLLSSLVQQLFNSVDIAVLGNMADTTSVAAVGATSITKNLMISLFFGITTGMCVILARALGSRDAAKVKRTVDTALLFSLCGGIFLAVVGWIFSPALMRLTDCPADCFDGAVLSLRVYALTAPLMLLKDAASRILTTAGNTKSSLYFMFVGGTAKVVFTILLCLIMPNKVLAVSLGTTISQLIWAGLALRRLCSGKDPVHLQLRILSPDLRTLGLILSQGIPISLYNCLFPLANMQIQTAINSYGSAVIAGNSAAIAMESVVDAFINTTCSAGSVFVGQNLGAEKPDRVRRSLWLCIGLDLVVITVLCVSVYLTGHFWMGLLLPDNPEAVEYAMIRMLFVFLPRSFHGLNMVLGQLLQSFGYSSLSSLNSVICVFGIRIAWMTWVYPRFQTYQMLVACFPFSWIFLFLLSFVMLTVVLLRYRKGIYKRL